MSPEFRILIVDDNPSIHEDFSQILVDDKNHDLSDLPSIPGIVYSKAEQDIESPTYRMDHAYQGEEAIRLVRQAQIDSDPYALVFMDVRMPPGPDGIETISRIWEIDPHLEVVICTAFSDYSWEKIIGRLGSTNHLMILKKPFDVIEVKQMALSLTSKWYLGLKNREYVEELQLEKVELAESRARAQESSKIKSDFIAIISHELKTPLTAILGYTNLLLHQSVDSTPNLNEKDQDAVERIDINARKLNDLIKDILFISEIESGTVQCNIGVFYPAKVIDRIVESMESLTFQKGLSVICNFENEEIHLNTDRVKFETIITNLISNAIKFTNEGTITVKTWSDDDLFYCSVTDTGIGIPADKYEVVFEKFRQVDQSLTRKHSGTGLGLAIAMRMSQMLGGSIEVKSVEGTGSTFTFSVRHNLEVIE